MGAATQLMPGLGRPDSGGASPSHASGSGSASGLSTSSSLNVEQPHSSLAAASHHHEGRRQRVTQTHDPWRVHKFVFAGGVAGALSRTATAPIDRLKMLLQVQEKRRMTLRQGMRLMAAEGSITSYFKGNGTNVLKIAPETSIKLTLNDYLKYKMTHEWGVTEPTPALRMLCGGVAGAVGQGLVYPLDTVRTRLAVCPKHEYCGIVPTMLRMARNEGAASFYRGFVPSMCGILPYAGIDICMFELLKDDLLQRYDGDPPHLAILCAGMVSSSVAQFVSYPLALVRTRLQAQGVSGMPVKYKGMLDVLRCTLAKEGFVGLYKGVLPNMIKLAPAAGISWYVFEATKKALGVDPRT